MAALFLLIELKASLTRIDKYYYKIASLTCVGSGRKTEKAPSKDDYVDSV
jgi:hypothetical protein